MQSTTTIKTSLKHHAIASSRFAAVIPIIFLYFMLLMLCLRTAFLAKNWASLQLAGVDAIAAAFWKGLRFDIAALSYFFLPALICYLLLSVTKRRVLHWLFSGYLISVALFVLLLWLADIQYFEEAGKHFTYEAFAYLDWSLFPILIGAFWLHPAISTLSLAVCAVFALLTGFGLNRMLKSCLPSQRIPAIFPTVSVIFFVMLAVIGARGGWQSRPLHIGNASISPNPYINALCLNPIYSVLQTFSTSEKQYQFFDEAFNIRTVRELLDVDPASLLSEDFPLLRTSTGTEQGNRKNVVLFILESWSGKDIDCLGGRFNVTPFFNELARQGVLFTNFYATGIRTSEGIFSLLCSFPNQPLKPVMHLPTIHQNHWRSLSQILAEVGYRNLFIHGRDLDFDHVSTFLKYIQFHTIIDMDDFPQSVSKTSDSWPGYDDEAVMRRAHEEFAAQTQPFLGVIYAMNTHPPFVTPENFPKKFIPGSVRNRFLNSLSYSDYTLRVFFDLARTMPYFNDTIFLFVADHARTRDRFTLSDQHYIPLLIYAPGYVAPAVNPVVSSQVDVLPTILGLLNLKTAHSSWGRNLLEVKRERGFAVCVAGNDVRWHDQSAVMNDSLSDTSPLLFDTERDPACTTDLWRLQPLIGSDLQTKLRAYVALSQSLLHQNRVYP